MIRKTVEFATAGTRLSVASGQLVIERPDHPRATVPVEDLGVVIVDDQTATYTQAVFISLLEAGATVMVTGRNHLPLGLMLPLDAHHTQTERHRAQVEASEPTRKQAWKTLVAAKLAQQGRVLEHFTGSHAGLVPMSKRVRSGDPDNLEAQGAQRYWPLLFGKEFRRDREAEGLNALLNYGYAVVRAATARAIVATGLIPSLGVFHKNRGNPFCLADDLLEPYRPFVDWRVKLIASEKNGETPLERRAAQASIERAAKGADAPARRGAIRDADFLHHGLSLNDRPTRAALLSLFNETILVDGKRTPLLLGVQTSAASLCRVLTGEGGTLALPEGMPLEPEPEPESVDDDDS